MHIPEHVLDPTTCMATGAISAAAIGCAVYRVQQDALPHKLPLMIVTGTFIFAAQMLNFPITAGTSGHFLGGALAGILLGPWAGMLAMSSIVLVQCILLGDGGFSALGANILNMAVIGSATGHVAYAKLTKQKLVQGVAAAAAAWCSVMIGAMACSAELSLSGGYPLTSTLTAMLSIHGVIGSAEAFVTGAVIAALFGRTLVPVARFAWHTALIGSACILLTAALLGPLASPLPDGLETVLSQAQKLAAQ